VVRSLRIVAIALLAGSSSLVAEASPTVAIEYDLAGSVTYTGPTGTASPAVFTTPVFETAAPGPGGAGSRVSFVFDATPGGSPLPSGQGTVQSLTLSHALSWLGYLTGFNRAVLTGGPITGGHLSGSVLFGSASGLASNTGFQHCIINTSFACVPLFGTPTWYFPGDTLPRSATGLPVPFGQWTFDPGFAGVAAGRFFSDPLWGYVWSGQMMLQGTEVGRTVLTPEPPLPALAGLIAAGLAGAAVWRLARRRRGTLIG